MSKDKYPSIFLKPNGGSCVYYPSTIFRNTIWGISPHIPRFQVGHIHSRDEFRPIACELKYLMDYNKRHSTRFRRIIVKYLF